ncbi:response regulator [Histidinibacterium aquaticum]|uniref:Response regulator n=1 Tax=Histidinibacterium aquaticum TaxID=2613962 RepID=A0A5J5GPV5_9RHOB|nr:response regulator [Histidinibacterium aquaticum]KAA9010369.1 response regulator [Histidinibacterium aquaticum]
MNSLDDYLATRPPTADRPLLGVTVLAVEDSRFASEALRLLCLRSGARIRRAESLETARRHLRVYRPTCIVVDLGLPDGDGEELIADLAGPAPAVSVILATSGEPDGEARALQAGADGFLAKPVASLAAFQEAILARLPDDRQPAGPRPLPEGEVDPDPIALRDDLAAMARTLGAEAEGHAVDYAAQFLGGLARSSGDAALSRAVADLTARRRRGEPAQAELHRLNEIVHRRLDQTAAI